MKKIAILSLSCLFMAAGCHASSSFSKATTRGGVVTASGKATKPPVRISATISKAEFAPGEDVAVHLVMVVEGALIYTDAHDFFHCYSARLMTPSGVADLSASGASFFANHVDGSHNRTLVGPRYTDVYDFSLSQLYDISEEGRYEIEFVRYVAGSSDNADPLLGKAQFRGSVVSNTVSFTFRRR